MIFKYPLYCACDSANLQYNAIFQINTTMSYCTYKLVDRFHHTFIYKYTVDGFHHAFIHRGRIYAVIYKYTVDV